MNKKIIKSILMCLSTIVSITGLVGCGNNEYISNSAGERVQVKKIKFLHIWSECNQQFTKIVNDFMAENEDIRIETIVSNYEDVPSYINSQVLSSSVPDVFFYWTNQVSGYAQNDVCLELDAYMDGWSNTFINDGEAWDLAKINGKHYSVPFRSTGDVVVYNKTLFEENNIKEPTTIQEFEDTLAKLRTLTTSPSFSPIALTGITSGTLIQFYTAFQNFSELLLGTYQDPNYQTGLLENTDENRIREGKMLDKLKDWNEKGYFGQCDGKSKDTSIRNFIEGNAAMLLLNNNNLYLLNDLEDVELGFMSIPSPAGVNYSYLNSDFDGFSVYKYSKYPEACIRFLKYLTSKNVCQYFSEETNSIMAVKDIEYKDAQNQAIAYAMRDCGKSIFIKNDVEYSTSNIQSQNVETILNYILGKKGSSGKEVADIIWERYLLAINEAKLQPLSYTIQINANADFSWLDIRV